MIATITYPEKDGTTKTVKCDIGDCNAQDMLAQLEPKNSDDRLKALLGKYKISSEARRWLRKLFRFTCTIGGKVIRIGAKILELLLLALKAFPTLALYLAVGLFLALLLSMIPFIGHFLRGVVLVLFAVLGIKETITNSTKIDEATKKAIKEKISEIFGILQSCSAPMTDGQPA